MLLEQISSLCLSSRLSDVIFIVENEKIFAHKVILGLRCDYFEVMLFGNMAEANQIEITLPNTTKKALTKIFEYLYTDSFNIKDENLDTLFNLIDLAHRFLLLHLLKPIQKQLRHMMDLYNICKILEKSLLYSLDKLTNLCLKTLDKNASLALDLPQFKNLNVDSLLLVLSRDTFFAPETSIQSFVSDWCQNNNNKALLKCVRLLDNPNLNKHKIFKPRGLYQFNSNYIQETVYSDLVIGDKNGLIIELKAQAFTNVIEFLFEDSCGTTFRYYIEASIDRNDWKKIVDYRNYDCCGGQKIYFTEQAVKFLKIVVTHCNSEERLQMKSVEVYLRKNPPKLFNGIIQPRANLALKSKHARLIRGISSHIYITDHNSYYTSHKIGDGGILIQLPQPFMLDQLQIYLKDDDFEYIYEYRIESSLDQLNWFLIAEERQVSNEPVKSIVKFEARAVVYIKITCVSSTVDDTLYVAYFACLPKSDNDVYLERDDSIMSGSDEFSSSEDDTDFI